MDKKKKIIISVVVALLLIGGVTAFILLSGKDKDKNDSKEITLESAKKYLSENFDKFKIDGSTSMIPLHQALSDMFSSEDKEVEHRKTVDAFDGFIKGEVDILLGVTYSDEILNEAKSSGVDLNSEEITREGFVFLINKDNPVKSLTEEQIKGIYSGEITNWKEVGGDNSPIAAFQRNDDSGSQIRMNKFMVNTKLMDKTYFAVGMGELVISIANFEQSGGKNAIGYNMYTFTEKQYTDEDVILLAVNGVKPTDESIFDESYSLVIYNYLYYDRNNKEASVFAENLHVYLMSEEGQNLISDAGYVNLNGKLDRNKDVDRPYDPDDPNDYWDGEYFYNKDKGEFYDVDNNGKLLVFKNYADFVLRDSKHKNNVGARDFLTRLYDAGIITSMIGIDNDTGLLMVSGLHFDASMDQEDFFNIRYNNIYYTKLSYSMGSGNVVLMTAEGIDLVEWLDGITERLPGAPINLIATKDIEIPLSELKNVYIRQGYLTESIQFDKVEYAQPFK